MKFKLTLFLSFLLASLVAAGEVASPPRGSLAFLDWNYGFRDLKFEQAVESSPGMVLLEDAGDLKFYTRKNDRLELGDAKLKSIEYGFYKGRLANVTIAAAGQADAPALLKSLEGDYGLGRQSPKGGSKLYWFGQKVLVDYVPSATGRTSVGMWSKPLQALQQADRAASK